MERYEELYHELIKGGKKENIAALGALLLWLMAETKKSATAIFKEAVEKMEAASWCNYLTAHEAESIAAGFINQDDSKGAHWSISEVEEAVEELGGRIECEPYYNKYALYVAMNMLYSDFADTINQFLGDGNMVEVIYRMAIDKLKDRDRPKFVRQYFGV